MSTMYRVQFMSTMYYSTESSCKLSIMCWLSFVGEEVRADIIVC